MRSTASRFSGLLAGVVLSAVAVGAGAGCGAGGAGRAESEDGASAAALAQRAREVAAAWGGSAAATAWRGGYHPVSGAVQLPRGGPRGAADRRAFAERRFVLAGPLPSTPLPDGRVVWPGGRSLVRPLTGAQESFRALRGSPEGEPHLTVTGARPGRMRLTTSFGPATVPAWLFDLKGYSSPLKQAAAIASKPPRSPIKWATGLAGDSLNQLSRISADGRTVTVIATYGACTTRPGVKVLETPDSVVLSSSTRARKTDGPCTKQARLRPVTVQLAKPLGDRILLDAITGRPVRCIPGRQPPPS